LVVVDKSEIPFIFPSKKFMDPYQDGIFNCDRDFDSRYVSLSKGKEDPKFSSLYQYLIFDLIIQQFSRN
jgi:hypothetical protein